MSLVIGFFNLRKSTLHKPSTKLVGCDACGLIPTVRSPKMPMTGEGLKKTYLLGEGPGETEDRLNKQFVGSAGDILRKFLRIYGYNLDRDFWKDNALCCRPTSNTGANRTPTAREIQLCKPNWRHNLSTVNPRFVFLMGGKAVEAYFSHRTQPITKNLSITRWRGLCIPDKEINAWILPMFHPSFINRNEDTETTFKLDLQNALHQLETRPDPTFEDYEDKVTILKNFEEISGLLDDILTQKYPIAIDFETSALKPYYPGHNIWSASISIYQSDHAYAFPINYPGILNDDQIWAVKEKLRKIMNDPEIVMVAQNIDMENIWGTKILRAKPQGWLLDTMVYAHVEDERRDYTSLDFQVFLHWGYEYGSEMDKFKKLAPGSRFNTIHQAPIDMLLKYGSKDAYFTMKLAELHWDKMENDSSPEIKDNIRAYDLYHEGILSFSDAEMEGIGINQNYYEQQKVILEDRMVVILKRLIQSPEASLYKAKAGKDLDFNSPQQINYLLHRLMGIKAVKFTEKGHESSDASVLEELNTPFTNNILKLRKLGKNKTTYIDGILNNQVDGRIHPNFNLHLVTTYRSSSSDPNFHNLPKRDKVAMALIRGGIIPSPGHSIIEVDYGAMEVRIIACYSRDAALIKQILETDVHQEWADFLGTGRFDAKNAFVFALFYGSYYKSIHRSLVRLYPNLDIDTVRRAEKEFWSKYRVSKRYQENLIKFYQTHGYVPMFHGFRRRGFLTVNQLINAPIQGTAFHCLLWSFVQINKIRKIEGWKTKLIGQIHDSIILDTHPSEKEHVISTVKRVMTESIVKAHDWLIVPLKAEIEAAEPDQPWHTKGEYDN